MGSDERAAIPDDRTFAVFQEQQPDVVMYGLAVCDVP